MSERYELMLNNEIGNVREDEILEDEQGDEDEEKKNRNTRYLEGQIFFQNLND